MKNITLNISVLIIAWSLFLAPSKIHAGAGTPITIDDRIVNLLTHKKLFKFPESIKAQIIECMKNLADLDMDDRLDKSLLSPQISFKFIWNEKYKEAAKEELKSFMFDMMLTVTKLLPDTQRILMVIKFCEGYNDETRRAVKQCSPHQIMKRYMHLYKNEMDYSARAYAAGVNTAARESQVLFP